MNQTLLNVALTLAAVVAAPLAGAQTASVKQATELRADKLPSAAIVAPLALGALVDVVSLEGNWALVRLGTPQSGAQPGWVRTDALAPSAAAQVGEQSALGTRSLPARSNRHALIIGIGTYLDSGVPPLPGTRHDKVSATQMAQYMQVPTSNISYLQDSQATGAAIRKALGDLNERAQPGDRVFVHYSGHGTRFNDAAAGGCVEALLSYDSDTITNREVAELLKPITAKTDKLFVMYDACHSGGLIGNNPALRSRGLVNDNDEGRIRPKFSGITEECGRPVNVKTRNLVVEQTAKGALPQDVIHLSASRDNEISFDDELKGGLATQFMRDCMLREAKDLDGSGAISIDEVRQCAQTKLNNRMRNDAQFKPHTLTLSGNSQFVPAWFAQASVFASNAIAAVVAPVSALFNSPMAAPAAPNPTMPVSAAALASAPPTAPAPPAPPVPPVAAVAATVASTPVAASALPALAPTPALAVVAPARPSPPLPPPPPPLTSAQAMAQLFEQRDAKRQVVATVPRQTLKIGQDVFDLSVSSDRDGYVYLLLAGSDNKSAYVLFPNDLDTDNRIKAGQKLSLPRPNWRVKAAGPAGEDTLLVLVTDGPRDMKALAGKKAGPFMASLNDADGRAQLGSWLGNSARGGGADCQRTGGQTSPSACSDAFGAVMLSTQETP